MRFEITKSNGGYQKWVIVLILISAIIGGALILAGYNLLESWASYDPKQIAENTIRRCLDQQSDSCGYITSSACLQDMRRSASETENAYQINVIWYNWEDKICCRGGDEVYLRVDFTNGDEYNILWYEGTLEQCEIPDTQTNNPP